MIKQHHVFVSIVGQATRQKHTLVQYRAKGVSASVRLHNLHPPRLLRCRSLSNYYRRHLRKSQPTSNLPLRHPSLASFSARVVAFAAQQHIFLDLRQVAR